MRRRLCGMLLATCVLGCSDVSYPKSTEQPDVKPVDGQDDRQDGMGKLANVKTTDDIGEFDPKAKNEIVDSDVEISNPITGALEAFGPLKQQISGIAVTQAIEMFRATEGRYPKNYQEFMSKVIQANQIRLPVPGKGLQYQYDVQNHTLVVVKLP